MTKYFWIALLAMSVFSHVFAETTVYHSPDSFVGKMILEMDQKERDSYLLQEKEKYQAVAKKFIEAAQNGNFKEMLNLTSALTIKNATKPEVQNIYETQIIPAFRHTTITWNPKDELTTDDTGNRGFIFTGQAKGATSFPFYMTVMKEKGRFRIITIRSQR